MNTKLVYVVVGSPADNYVEQAFVSAWSAKWYNHDSVIVFLCDDRTYDYIMDDRYRELRKNVDSIVSIKVPDYKNNTDKSRWIKTRARMFVEGDMLYIDTDTVVCGPLADLDGIDSNVAAVWDFHIPFKETPFCDDVIRKVSKLFHYNLDKNSAEYFNSGIIYSKDNQYSRKLYKEWHHYWLQSQKKGVSRDQPALARTVIDNRIDRMDDVYNCMIRSSIQYLHKAKILHVFNSGWGGENISPFFTGEIYEEIKRDKRISEKSGALILDCKSQFSSPTIIMDHSDSLFIFSPAYKLLKELWERKSVLVYPINLFARFLLKVGETIEINRKKR